MKRIGWTIAALALAAPAFAQTGVTEVVERLAAQGYGQFEIAREDGTVKVEAIRNGVQRELVYDATDGALIEDSQRPATRAARAEDNGGRVSRDRRTEAGDDRDDRSDAADDRGGDEDDEDDDNGGSRGRDDDGGSDDGGRGGRDDSGGRGGHDDSGGRGGRGGDDHGGGRGGDDD